MKILLAILGVLNGGYMLLDGIYVILKGKYIGPEKPGPWVWMSLSSGLCLLFMGYCGWYGCMEF